MARAISQFEPLFMIANPGEAAANARKVFANDANVTVVEMPINDGWTRDWGPSVGLCTYTIAIQIYICITITPILKLLPKRSYQLLGLLYRTSSRLLSCIVKLLSRKYWSVGPDQPYQHTR